MSGSNPISPRNRKLSADGRTVKVYTFFLRSFRPCRTIADGIRLKSFFRQTRTRRATALFPVENSTPFFPCAPVTIAPPIRRSASSSPLLLSLSGRTTRASSFFTCSVNDITSPSPNTPTILQAQYWFSEVRKYG